MTQTQQILAEQFTERGAQSALARKVGVTRQAVSRWMVGLNQPSGMTIVRMARSDDECVRAVGFRLMETLHPELAGLMGSK